MAQYGSANADQEFYDSPEVIEQKVDKLVELIKKSGHFIVFTGAGISTSAGIPDFRGPQGVWTLRAQGKEPVGGVDTLQALPTKTHMALVELQNQGILRHLVSQNCDGLHRKSGILPGTISELHGNSNRECCKACGKEYIRDFRAVSTYEISIHDHRTGRKCGRCGGALHDSIVNFGESLPEGPLDLAQEHAEKADLCLVLGSSLTVGPANMIPWRVGERRSSKRRAATLAICNLQNTPVDDLCDLRIYAKTDIVMSTLMQKLGLPIPEFVLHRRLAIRVEADKSGRSSVTVEGVDVDGTPVTFLKSVKLKNNRRTAQAEPFRIEYRGSIDLGTQLEFELEFMGHYGEPNLDISHAYLEEGDREVLYFLAYNPQTGEWKASRQSGNVEDESKHMKDSDGVKKEDEEMEVDEHLPSAGLQSPIW